MKVSHFFSISNTGSVRHWRAFGARRPQGVSRPLWLANERVRYRPHFHTRPVPQYGNDKGPAMRLGPVWSHCRISYFFFL